MNEFGPPWKSVDTQAKRKKKKNNFPAYSSCPLEKQDTQSI